MGKFKGECAVSWYIDRKNSWKSEIPSRSPELLALGTNKGSISHSNKGSTFIPLPALHCTDDVRDGSAQFVL